MPWLLYPQGKSPLYPLHRRLGGPHSQSQYDGAEEKMSLLPLLRTDPSHAAHSLVTIQQRMDAFTNEE